jgi:hypothetical protein
MNPKCGLWRGFKAGAQPATNITQEQAHASDRTASTAQASRILPVPGTWNGRKHKRVLDTVGTWPSILRKTSTPYLRKQ